MGNYISTSNVSIYSKLNCNLLLPKAYNIYYWRGSEINVVCLLYKTVRQPTNLKPFFQGYTRFLSHLKSLKIKVHRQSVVWTTSLLQIRKLSANT